MRIKWKFTEIKVGPWGRERERVRKKNTNMYSGGGRQCGFREKTSILFVVARGR